jgi:hypothetical protein
MKIDENQESMIKTEGHLPEFFCFLFGWQILAVLLKFQRKTGFKNLFVKYFFLQKILHFFCKIKKPWKRQTGHHTFC